MKSKVLYTVFSHFIDLILLSHSNFTVACDNSFKSFYVPSRSFHEEVFAPQIGKLLSDKYFHGLLKKFINSVHYFRPYEMSGTVNVLFLHHHHAIFRPIFTSLFHNGNEIVLCEIVCFIKKNGCHKLISFFWVINFLSFSLFSYIKHKTKTVHF